MRLESFSIVTHLKAEMANGWGHDDFDLGRLGMARDIRQRLLNDAEYSGRGKFTQGNVAIAQHKFTGDARIPDELLYQPLQCGNDTKIQSPRPQARRDMPCGLDGTVHQVC